MIKKTKKNIFNLTFLLVVFSSFSIWSYEFAIGSMFRNEAPYLKEWIEYHKMIGVDHFFLYNDKSTDNWEEVLSPYIQDGLVEVFYWPTKDRNQYYANQSNAFRNSLQRGVSTQTTWLAFIDIDEFLLPMKDSNIVDCMNRHFSDAGAVYVNWRCFGAGKNVIPTGDPLIFDLTACSLKNHPKNSVGKSIVRPQCALIKHLWYAHTTPLKEGFFYLNGSKKIMPFEGINLPTDGKTHQEILRINHYVMRDKGFFENVRLARARNGYEIGYSMANEQLILEENASFSLIEDRAIIRFIEKNYPEKAKEIWKKQG